MARKRENGYGGITKKSGNRKRPYIAYKSEMVVQGVILPEEYENTLKSGILSIEQASSQEEIYRLVADTIFSMDEIASSVPGIEDCKKAAIKMLNDKYKETSLRRVQRKVQIGSYRTYKEAELALAEYNKNPHELKKKVPTFAELYEPMYADMRVAEKSDSTQNMYKQGFDKCQDIHHRPINELRTEELEAVLKKYEGMSQSTQKAPLTVIREIFKYADKHDLIDKDYSVYLKTGKTAEKKDKNPYTREQVQKLWTFIDWEYKTSHKNSPWYGLKLGRIILVLIYTGMRIDELMSIKKKDAYLNDGYIDVVDAKTDAGRRIVPIHPAIKNILQEFYDNANEYMIENRDGYIDYKILTKTPLPNFYKALGFTHTLHEARHTFATYSLASKFDPTLRYYIIGHKTRNITDEVYTHPEVLIPELIEEIKKLKIV